MKRSEREKIRARNCKGESVYRNMEDHFYPIEDPQVVPRSPYPWETDSNHPRITKDFFRCKGSSGHAPIIETKDLEQPMTYTDCDGGTRHGLPFINGKPGVYPVLVNLLNYIQKKTAKRVIITSGHRCPFHNCYVDPSKKNQTSKHQVGAEVDFYVQGMEDRPLEVVGLLMQYYQDASQSQNAREYQHFARYEKPDADVEIFPWMNKEIYIKLHQKHEGRNFDNRHPHPYITIQVRFDRQKGSRVVYDWKAANQGYSRCL